MVQQAVFCNLALVRCVVEVLECGNEVGSGSIGCGQLLGQAGDLVVEFDMC